MLTEREKKLQELVERIRKYPRMETPTGYEVIMDAWADTLEAILAIPETAVSMTDELFMKRAAEEDGCMISAIGLKPLHAPEPSAVLSEEQVLKAVQEADGDFEPTKYAYMDWAKLAALLAKPAQGSEQ